MKRIVLIAISAVSMLPAARADECMDKAQDQAAMTACAEQAYKSADAELNALYREIEQRLGADRDARHLLVGAERAWVAFRDAECTFASSGVDGGSAYPMVQSMCLGELTRKRGEELRQYLDCEEGDVSCPVPPAE
ncbi:MAG: lysozyme inhibitor LprI family protein [Rhizobiaceae bacterium]|nr:lysozyme inhibitor LprI family protein [Rhizobiaceae bacterium]MCV0405613.1 lysozyme inhibitor LprI family protein [Rhizobiaceae bacterium]